MVPPLCPRLCFENPSFAIAHRLAPAFVWAGLEGPHIYNLCSFLLLRPAPKTQSTHERALEVAPELIFGPTFTIFEPEPVPRLPGPDVGPQGPKVVQKLGPDLSLYPPQGLPTCSGSCPGDRPGLATWALRFCHSYGCERF